VQRRGNYLARLYAVYGMFKDKPIYNPGIQLSLANNTIRLQKDYYILVNNGQLVGYELETRHYKNALLDSCNAFVKKIRC